MKYFILILNLAMYGAFCFIMFVQSGQLTSVQGQLDTTNEQLKEILDFEKRVYSTYEYDVDELKKEMIKVTSSTKDLVETVFYEIY